MRERAIRIRVHDEKKSDGVRVHHEKEINRVKVPLKKVGMA